MYTFSRATCSLQPYETEDTRLYAHKVPGCQKLQNLHQELPQSFSPDFLRQMDLVACSGKVAQYSHHHSGEKWNQTDTMGGQCT